MLGLFAGCLGAAWLQFCRNWAAKRTVERGTTRACLLAYDPVIVDRWVAYLEVHNAVLVIGRSDYAVAVATPKPERVH